jgi:FG-GAP-like repeat
VADVRTPLYHIRRNLPAMVVFAVGIMSLAPVGVVAAAPRATTSLDGDGLAFSPARYYIPTDNVVTWLAVADLTRDRRQDLIAGTVDTEGGPWKTKLLTGRAGGGFSRVRDLGLLGTGGVAAADFDGDANPDLVRARFGIGVAVGLGDGHGGLRARRQFGCACAFPERLVVGDFNEDGRPDLVISDPEGPEPGVLPEFPAVSVLLGDGGGGFSAPRRFDSGIGPLGVSDYPFGPFDVAVGNVDGDRHADLVVTNPAYYDAAVDGYRGGDVRLLRGDGLGAFVLGGVYEEAGRRPSSVAVGRFDRDRKLDLAVLNSRPNSARDEVRVLSGDGLGGFRARSTYRVARAGRGPRSIANADLNHDGRPDLVVGGTDVRILLGKGRGRFGPALRFPVSGGDGELVAADLNRDRRVDLAGTCGYGCANDRKGVFVLLNRTRHATRRQP